MNIKARKTLNGSIFKVMYKTTVTYVNSKDDVFWVVWEYIFELPWESVQRALYTND